LIKYLKHLLFIIIIIQTELGVMQMNKLAEV